jgi:branched-chain amino acid aminotransferase
MYPYCFFEDKIVKSDKPLIKVNDISVLRGFAAFDFLRIYNGKPFCFDEHFKRFQNTSREMGLKLPYSKDQILQILNNLVIKNKDKNFQVKFVLTGGPTINGILPSKPILFIIFEKMQDLPDNVYKKGAKLITNEYLRTLPTSKTSNYLNAVLLQKQKDKQKALEILYINNGEVLECSTSNIFIVKDNAIFTPKENVLYGITRQKVLQIAKKNKIKANETKVTFEDLKNADEVFMTATNKKVVPIVQIDNFKIGNGEVGEMSKILLKEYGKTISSICRLF